MYIKIDLPTREQKPFKPCVYHAMHTMQFITRTDAARKKLQNHRV